MSSDENHGDQDATRTFSPGEKVWVHDARAPHSLRRATVVRINHPGQTTTYTVEAGLGGEMQAEASQMHHLSDQPPVSGCSHCAADPNAANARRG